MSHCRGLHINVPRWGTVFCGESIARRWHHVAVAPLTFEHLYRRQVQPLKVMR